MNRRQALKAWIGGLFGIAAAPVVAQATAGQVSGTLSGSVSGQFSGSLPQPGDPWPLHERAPKLSFRVVKREPRIYGEMVTYEITVD